MYVVDGDKHHLAQIYLQFSRLISTGEGASVLFIYLFSHNASLFLPLRIWRVRGCRARAVDTH